MADHARRVAVQCRRRYFVQRRDRQSVAPIVAPIQRARLRPVDDDGEGVLSASCGCLSWWVCRADRPAAVQWRAGRRLEVSVCVGARRASAGRRRIARVGETEMLTHLHKHQPEHLPTVRPAGAAPAGAGWLRCCGCRKPKLRERRRPLGSTCCSTSHRNSAPSSVRTARLPVLASQYWKVTLPSSQRRMSASWITPRYR